VTAAALAVLLAFGLLTLWVRESWAAAAVQSGVLTLAAALVWRRLRGHPLAWNPLLLPPLLIAAWAALQGAAGWTEDPGATRDAARFWLAAAAAALCAAEAGREPEDRRRLLDALLIFAVAVAAAGLLDALRGSGRAFGIFETGYADGVMGPFVYRNRFAMFLELVLPALLWRGLEGGRRGAWWFAGASVCFAAGVAAASRAGFLLMSAETAAVLWLARRRGLDGAASGPRLALGAAGLAAVTALLAGWEPLARRLFGLDPLADVRLSILASSAGMAGRFFWRGCGLGAWPAVYPEFARFDNGLYVNQAHNDWVQWLAEGGLPMALACVLLAWGWLRAAWRTGWGLGLAALLVHALADYPFQQAPAFVFFAFAWASLACASWRAEVFERYKTPGPGTVSLMTRSAVFLLALATAASWGAAQTRPTPPVGPMGDAGLSNLPGLRIGPNDLVAVSVYDAPEFTRTVRISAEGDLRLPMVAKRIRAQGLLPAELEQSISDALAGEGLLVKPVVMVTVVEYYSRPIAVVGAVRKPLTFQAVGRVSLLDALARAEGLAPESGPEIVLSRPGPQGSLLRRIPVRELIDEARAELNVLLEGGEEIRVPEARKIYVTGNVKRPGAFPVKEGAELTVLKALALAEGLAPFSQKQAFVYRPKDGGKQEISVELQRIIQRKAPDLVLLADDVLYIPEDRGRRTTATVLEKAAGFGMATASGVLVWRR
jgi:polysaccharide export outer membrane protein